MATAFASVFSLLLGYSRIPYAAARDGNFFRVFGRLHRRGFPHRSLLMLGAGAVCFCFLSLSDVIAALVVLRILLQFLMQQVGVMVLRRTQPEMKRPFRVWLYPLPPLVAIAGFLFILIKRTNFQREILMAAVVIALGSAVYALRERLTSNATN
jgi:amino acid transporter